LFLFLVTATVISVQQAQLAKRESSRAKEFNKFLTTMLSSANPSWVNANALNTGSVTVRQVLDGTSELLARQKTLDPSVEAELHLQVGLTYTSLGVVDQGRTHLETALKLATAQGDRRLIAYSESGLGTNATARGDFKSGEAFGRLAVQYYRASNEPTEEMKGNQIGELAAAVLYQRPGDPEGIALFREALGFLDHAGSVAAPITYHNLAVALVRSGRIAEGEAAVRESLRRMDALPRQIPERASALRTLAATLFQQGKYAEAEPLAREAVEFAIKTRPPNHPLLPNNKAWWGRLLIATGQFERGLAMSQEAYDGYSKIRPAGHQDLVLPLIGIGAAYRELGKLRESERILREAETIIRKFPAQRDRTADMAGELGLTLRAMGRKADGDLLIKESHDILQRAYGDDHPLTKQAKARISN
jgi:tetratricopeptide (TPR) repeat protein